MINLLNYFSVSVSLSFATVALTIMLAFYVNVWIDMENENTNKRRGRELLYVASRLTEVLARLRPETLFLSSILRCPMSSPPGVSFPPEVKHPEHLSISLTERD